MLSIATAGIIASIDREIGVNSAAGTGFMGPRQAAVTQARPFREMLAKDPHVSAGLTPAQVDGLLDPARYARLCRQLAERGAARAREIAAPIASRATVRT